MGMPTVRRALRTLLLCLALGGTLLAVPEPTPTAPELALVKVDRARGVDLNPDVIWILAVGSDARPGDDILRSRGDAIQLVGLNTENAAATAFGIPRDSYVDIPGYGRDKINAALQYGGPQLMADAVGGLVGIRADYVMVTGFSGFENMVNAIGGITVDSAHTFSDAALAPVGFREGENKLDGRKAMAFSRIRKALPAGDFDRSANQQRTLRGILGALRDRSHRPGFVEAGVRAVLANMLTDVSAADMFKIAQAMAQVDPSKVTTCVIPGGVGYAGAASVVFPDVGTARRLGDQARKDATLQSC
jgi:LCP family protein required for cell wall assembly